MQMSPTYCIIEMYGGEWIPKEREYARHSQKRPSKSGPAGLDFRRIGTHTSGHKTFRFGKKHRTRM